MITQTITHRQMCFQCRQPDFNCFCGHVKPFDPKIKFVILIHPIEVRRRVATGRLSHLCLKSSELIVGHSYSENKRVNEILNDPQYHCVLLYPGINSKNLSLMDNTKRKDLFPEDKKLVIFVVDGTWNTAKKMVRLSENLKDLPQIAFIPPGPSNFRVRQQPRANYFSTVEAIHHTIELVGFTQGFDTTQGEHHALINVFNKMVEKQLIYVKRSQVRHVRKAV